MSNNSADGCVSIVPPTKLRLVRANACVAHADVLDTTARFRMTGIRPGKTVLRPSAWADFVDRLWPGEQVHLEHTIVRKGDVATSYEFNISLVQSLACRASESRLALPQALKSLFPLQRYEACVDLGTQEDAAWPVRARLEPAALRLMDANVGKVMRADLLPSVVHPGELPNWVLTAPFDEPLAEALRIEIRIAAVEFDAPKQDEAMSLLRRIRCGAIRAAHPNSAVTDAAHDPALVTQMESRLRQWVRHPAPAYVFDVIIRSPAALSNYVLQRLARDVFGAYPWTLELADDAQSFAAINTSRWPFKSEQGQGGWFPGTDRALGFGVPAIDPEPAGLPLGLGAQVGVCGTTAIIIPDSLRTSHVAVVGGSGTGKSTLLLRLLEQDMARGHGCGLIDPHGDLVDAVIGVVPRHRVKDVVLIDVEDPCHSVALNPMDGTRGNALLRNFVASQIVDLVERLFENPTTTGPVLRNNLRNALLLAMCHPEGGTIADAARLFEDNDFRDWLKSKSDEQLRDYFKAFERSQGSENGFDAWKPYILARLHPFTKNPALLRLFNRPSTVSISKLMDEGRIVLFRLSKATLQDIECKLAGSLLTMQFHIAALARAKLPPEVRRPFHLVIDEFHTFANESTPALFREARKFGLGLTVATQSFSSLRTGQGSDLVSAVLASTATKVLFRLSPQDANLVDDYSEPAFSAKELTKTRNHHAVVCMSASETPAFRMKADQSVPAGDPLPIATVSSLSGEAFGTPNAEVHEYLARRHGVSVDALRHSSPWSVG